MRQALLLPYVSGLLLALVPAVALGQVDCSNPDNLCTGDPCVIPVVEVVSPCTVDFGSRTVVLAGRMRVPSAGTLDLSAGTILVRAPLITRRVPGPGIASLTLTAVDDLLVDGPIRLTGILSGSLMLHAGGDIEVRDRIIGTGQSSGGDISLVAGGNILVHDRITSKSLGSPGSITLDAGGDIDVQQRLQVTDVFLFSPGLLVTADGVITIAGGVLGGPVTVRGAAGVSVQSLIDLRRGEAAVELSSSGGGVTLDGRILRVRRAPVTLSAAGDVVVNGTVQTVFSPIIVTSAAGQVTLGAFMVGEAVVVTAAGPATIAGDVRLDQFVSPTTLRVEAASILLPAGTSIDADEVGQCPCHGGAELRFAATSGDLTLGGSLFARGVITGGTIEGSATGNLVANGVFRAAPDGCIGLSAGGTVDTTGGSFDRPVVTDCPGSPSGAFLDGDGGAAARR